ncbi:MAG: hypothetical protein F4Y35_03775 [Chloroflexi bacterium]|nr:hypothetical protein [Chloroflexota bacterium]
MTRLHGLYATLMAIAVLIGAGIGLSGTAQSESEPWTRIAIWARWSTEYDGTLVSWVQNLTVRDQYQDW